MLFKYLFIPEYTDTTFVLTNTLAYSNWIWYDKYKWRVACKHTTTHIDIDDFTKRHIIFKGTPDISFLKAPMYFYGWLYATLVM